MATSCHIYRFPFDLWEQLSQALDALAETRSHKVMLETLGKKEIQISFTRHVGVYGKTRYFTLTYPEPITYEDYETGKIITVLKREKTIIVPLHDDIEKAAFLFLCGGSADRAKGILEKLVENAVNIKIKATPFTIYHDEMEELIATYGFDVRYARLDRLEMEPDVDGAAFWGSNIAKAKLYKGIKSYSRDPNREVRLIDKSNQKLGTIGVTRIHNKSKTLVVRIWKNMEPDVISSYILERIIIPVLKIRKK